MKEEADGKFGFLTKAIKDGAPLYGGIMIGFDRMVMILAGDTSARDSIAFPKTTSAVFLADDLSPRVSEEQLSEKNRLH